MNDWQFTWQAQEHQRNLSRYVSSHRGRSSSVPFASPSVAEQETRPLSIPCPANQAEPLKRIVVIDDSPTIRAILNMSFTEAGFEVQMFADGVTFFRWFLTPGASIPDLLFLDLILPKLDGYEVAKRLNGHPAFQKTVLYLMSGKDGTPDQLRGRLVGARGYLIKPFQAQDALAIANAVLKPASLKQ